KKIPDIVNFEAKQQIPFPLEDVVWDYQKIGGGEEEEGFALETDNGLAKARKKLVDKALDMIVLNYVGEHTGFDVDTNELSILFASGRQEDLGPAPKAELARKLLEKVASLL
ncbi:MAG: phosphopantothenoylcysteine decarboxylase, partial [Candidatus Zixiibacteriota bacterium]